MDMTNMSMNHSMHHSMENMDMGNMSMANMNMDNNMDMNMDMKMHFYFGFENVQMFLKTWFISTKLQLFLSCLAVSALTITGEFIRIWQENQMSKIVSIH